MMEKAAFWKDTLERLLWTWVQGATSVLTLDQFGWIDLQDGELWKAAAAGGLAAVFSFAKALAAQRLMGGTAQLGTKTYSYTESGPGSAGGDM